MPYKSINDLPRELSGLPINAKKIFIEAFNTAYNKYKSESKAFQLAWGVVKKTYHKEGTKWTSSKINQKKNILKSMISTHPIYNFSAVLSNTEIDSDSSYNQVSPSLLQKLSNPSLVDKYGSIEHDDTTKGLYILNNISKVNDELHINFTLNNEHPNFSNQVEKHKKGEMMYLSAEFKNAITYGDLIIDAEELGWTLTNSPANKSSKIYKIDRKND